jgi:hypothetical protein
MSVDCTQSWRLLDLKQIWNISETLYKKILEIFNKNMQNTTKS